MSLDNFHLTHNFDLESDSLCDQIQSLFSDKNKCTEKDSNPSRLTKVAVSKKKKNFKKINPTLSQQKEILDWYHLNGRKQSKKANHVLVKYPKLRFGQLWLSEWLKVEQKLCFDYEFGIGLHSR